MAVCRSSAAAECCVLGLAACNPDGGVGYVEIKTVPAASAPALYLDTAKLEPVRNGTAVLRQKVGTSKLQVDGEGGQLALLCNIVVQKNRITSVTVSSRAARHAASAAATAPRRRPIGPAWRKLRSAGKTRPDLSWALALRRSPSLHGLMAAAPCAQGGAS